MSGTTIDAALTALVTLFKGAGMVKVGVIDGPAYDPPNNFLAVGWDRSDQPAVVATKVLGDYGTTDGLEQYTVSSLLSFSYDDGEVTVVRGLLTAAFDQLDTALGLDPTLGGLVLNAWIGEYELTPILTEAGTVADLRFSTVIRASR